MKPKYLIISVIIGSLIIGFSIIIVQSMKQSSIERQQSEQLASEERKRASEILEKSRRQDSLEECLTDADLVYWNYIKSNGELVDKEKGEWRASQSDWDEAAERKKDAVDICFKKYPQ